MNGEEPKPNVQRPPCPSGLSKVAKKEWRRIVRELETLKILARIDCAALAAYCESWARWREAEQKIAETSLVIKTKSGNIIENPYYSVAKRERELMLKFLVEFGMTPSSRTRLHVQIPQEPQKGDRFFA
jgi:P27 family predicted phage terminase small subunit